MVCKICNRLDMAIKFLTCSNSHDVCMLCLLDFYDKEFNKNFSEDLKELRKLEEFHKAVSDLLWSYMRKLLLMGVVIKISKLAYRKNNTTFYRTGHTNCIVSKHCPVCIQIKKTIKRIFNK